MLLFACLDGLSYDDVSAFVEAGGKIPSVHCIAGESSPKAGTAEAPAGRGMGLGAPAP